MGEQFRSCPGALKRFRTGMRSETDRNYTTRSQGSSGGRNAPLLNGFFCGWRREYPFIPREWVWMSHEVNGARFRKQRMVRHLLRSAFLENRGDEFQLEQQNYCSMEG